MADSWGYKGGDMKRMKRDIYRLLLAGAAILIGQALHGLTSQELITMIEQGEQEIKQSNIEMGKIDASLRETLKAMSTLNNDLKRYTQTKNQYWSQVNTIKQTVNQKQEDMRTSLATVPGLDAVVFDALKPPLSLYNRFMGNIDTMFTRIDDLLLTARADVTQLEQGINYSINTTMPKIMAKADETLKKLAELKQRAPAIAEYVSGLTQQFGNK